MISDSDEDLPDLCAQAKLEALEDEQYLQQFRHQPTSSGLTSPLEDVSKDTPSMRECMVKVERGNFDELLPTSDNDFDLSDNFVFSLNDVLEERKKESAQLKIELNAEDCDYKLFKESTDAVESMVGVKDVEMPGRHPGLPIFTKYDSSTCVLPEEFIKQTPETSLFEKFLLIKSDNIELMFYLSSSKLLCVKDCPSIELFNFLFHLLGSHPTDIVVRYMVTSLICESLQKHSNALKSLPWFPSISQVLCVICNIGSEIDILFPEEFRANFSFDCPHYPISNSSHKKPTKIGNALEVIAQSLGYICDVLNCVVTSGFVSYTWQEAIFLLIIIMRASLQRESDVTSSNMIEFIKNLIEYVPQADFEMFATEFVVVFPRISGHHHDTLFLTSLFHEDRAFSILRPACFVTLYNIIEKCFHVKLQKRRLHCEIATSYKIGMLPEILMEVKPQQFEEEEMYYPLRSFISILNRCFAYRHYNSSLCNDLKALTYRLSSIQQGIRDHALRMHRSEVKDRVIYSINYITTILSGFTRRQTQLFASPQQNKPLSYVQLEHEEIVPDE